MTEPHRPPRPTSAPGEPLRPRRVPREEAERARAAARHSSALRLSMLGVGVGMLWAFGVGSAFAVVVGAVNLWRGRVEGWPRVVRWSAASLLVGALGALPTVWLFG
jgi:hypothetical protein